MTQTPPAVIRLLLVLQTGVGLSAQTIEAQSASASIAEYPIVGGIACSGTFGSGPYLAAVFRDLQSDESRSVALGQSAFGVRFDAVHDDEVVVTVGTDARSLKPGDLLVTSASSPAAATATGSPSPVFLDRIGLVSAATLVSPDVPSQGWGIRLLEYRSDSSSEIREGESSFGFVALQIKAGVATIRVIPSVSEFSPDYAAPIPDLAGLVFSRRDSWVRNWRDWLGSQRPDEASAARQRMRAYWSEQWQGAWGRVVSKTMSGFEQQKLRSLVAEYWR